MRLDFFYQVFLLVQIYLLIFMHTAEVGSFIIKEIIAGCPEALPNLIRMLARNRAQLFPFLLQANQFLCGFFPIGAILETFSLYTKINLEVIVIQLFMLDAVEVLFLVCKKSIHCTLEAIPDFSIFFFRGTPDTAPYFEQFIHLIGQILPSFHAVRRNCKQFISLLTETCFCQKILFLLSLQLTVMFTATFIYLISG